VSDLDSEASSLAAVVQDALTGEVLWVGLLPRETVRAAVRSGTICIPALAEGRPIATRHVARTPDGGGLVVLVDGPNGRNQLDSVAPDHMPMTAVPGPELVELERVLLSRKTEDRAQSYTRMLLEAGIDRIGEKLREEADELAHALDSESDDRVAAEAADLVYHLLVALLARGMAFRSAVEVLASRSGVGGLADKERRGKPPVA